MPRHLAHRLTSLPWQFGISTVFTVLIAAAIFSPPLKVDLSTVDRATFVSALGAVATLVALFCSLSLTWILFSYQQVKGQRTAAYDMMKQCLMEAERWLHSSKHTDSRELCLSLLWEIDKIELADIPQLGSIPEYVAYCAALESGLDSEDRESRRFFQRSSFYFSRIEQLLSRFGVGSIQQIRLQVFIDTLAKGFIIVAASVAALLCSLLWFSEQARPAYVMAAAFLSAATVLVLLEVWVDLTLEYEEELDFVEHATEA